MRAMVRTLLLVILLCLTLIATTDIILLNLYINGLIILPHNIVWWGLRSAYDLFLFPTTLLANSMFIGYCLLNKKHGVNTNE